MSPRRHALGPTPSWGGVRCGRLPAMTTDPNDTTATNLVARTVPSPDPFALPRKNYDVIVIGAGVAGLAFTLSLPPDLRVALLTKGVLGESNTRYAQGGLAAAVGTDDSPALHAADTLTAGGGLREAPAGARLGGGGPG